MGRWSQQRRRGGGPPPPPTAVQVDFIIWDSMNEEFQIQFTGPISNTGAPTLSNFEVDDGGGFAAVSSVAAWGVDFVHVQAPTPFGPGQNWRFTAQPPEITTPIDPPLTGVTT